jgi:hypothetical protein
VPGEPGGEIPRGRRPTRHGRRQQQRPLRVSTATAAARPPAGRGEGTRRARHIRDPCGRQSPWSTPQRAPAPHGHARQGEPAHHIRGPDNQGPRTTRRPPLQCPRRPRSRPASGQATAHQLESTLITHGRTMTAWRRSSASSIRAEPPPKWQSWPSYYAFHRTTTEIYNDHRRAGSVIGAPQPAP